MVISANFLFFREEPINRHPKENPLKIEEDIEEDSLNQEQIEQNKLVKRNINSKK